MAVFSLKYPRLRRLRKRAEFLACYAHGLRLHSEHFMLFARDCPGPCRFGVAVSRKIGNAVRRNRVKRLLKEFFRLHAASQSRGELVAVAKKGAAARLALADVAAELGPLLARLRKSREQRSL